MKKGQTALDFLMTYGWAILVVLIAIGLLWYSISPQDYNQTCLDNFANNYCRENNSSYLNMNLYGNPSFYCDDPNSDFYRTNGRDHNNFFFFTPQELEECKE